MTTLPVLQSIDKRRHRLFRAIHDAASYALAIPARDPLITSHYETFFRVLHAWSAPCHMNSNEEEDDVSAMRLTEFGRLPALSKGEDTRAREYASTHRYSRNNSFTVLETDAWGAMFDRETVPPNTHVSMLVLSAIHSHLGDLSEWFPQFACIADSIDGVLQSISDGIVKGVRNAMEASMRMLVSPALLIGFGIQTHDERKKKNVLRLRTSHVKRRPTTTEEAKLDSKHPTDSWRRYDELYKEYSPALLNFEVEEVAEASSSARLPLDDVHRYLDALTDVQCTTAHAMLVLSGVLQGAVHRLSVCDKGGFTRLTEPRHTEAARLVLRFMGKCPVAAFQAVAFRDGVVDEADSTHVMRGLLLAWFGFFQNDRVIRMIEDGLGTATADTFIPELVSFFSNWLLCDIRPAHKALRHVVKRIVQL